MFPDDLKNLHYKIVIFFQKKYNSDISSISLENLNNDIHLYNGREFIRLTLKNNNFLDILIMSNYIFLYCYRPKIYERKVYKLKLSDLGMETLLHYLNEVSTSGIFDFFSNFSLVNHFCLDDIKLFDKN